MTQWESTIVPDFWVEESDKYDEWWTANQFGADAMLNAGIEEEKIHVYDSNGKRITEFFSTNPTSQLAIENLDKGYYIVQFFNKNSLLIGSLNAIH